MSHKNIGDLQVTGDLVTDGRADPLKFNIPLWLAGENYLVNDIVLDAGVIYTCKAVHTSTTSVQDDMANWDVQFEPSGVYFPPTSTIDDSAPPPGPQILHEEMLTTGQEGYVWVYESGNPADYLTHNWRERIYKIRALEDFEMRMDEGGSGSIYDPVGIWNWGTGRSDDSSYEKGKFEIIETIDIGPGTLGDTTYINGTVPAQTGLWKTRFSKKIIVDCGDYAFNRTYIVGFDTGTYYFGSSSLSPPKNQHLSLAGSTVIQIKFTNVNDSWPAFFKIDMDSSAPTVMRFARKTVDGLTILGTTEMTWPAGVEEGGTFNMWYQENGNLLIVEQVFPVSTTLAVSQPGTLGDTSLPFYDTNDTLYSPGERYYYAASGTGSGGIRDPYSAFNEHEREYVLEVVNSFNPTDYPNDVGGPLDRGDMIIVDQADLEVDLTGDTQTIIGMASQYLPGSLEPANSRNERITNIDLSGYTGPANPQITLGQGAIQADANWIYSRIYDLNGPVWTIRDVGGNFGTHKPRIEINSIAAPGRPGFSGILQHPDDDQSTRVMDSDWGVYEIYLDMKDSPPTWHWRQASPAIPMYNFIGETQNPRNLIDLTNGGSTQNGIDFYYESSRRGMWFEITGDGGGISSNYEFGDANVFDEPTGIADGGLDIVSRGPLPTQTQLFQITPSTSSFSIDTGDIRKYKTIDWYTDGSSSTINITLETDFSGTSTNTPGTKTDHEFWPQYYGPITIRDKGAGIGVDLSFVIPGTSFHNRFQDGTVSKTIQSNGGTAEWELSWDGTGTVPGWNIIQTVF